MQFPESWLREFCNPPLGSAQLAELLTMSGFEVEEARAAAPAFAGIVVAEIIEAVQHPNADRLRVCRVDAGAHSPAGPLQIVCGAPNARVGIKVPLALVGTSLPPGEDGKVVTISAGKLRGVESQGMLCSARELKLSDDHAGLMELAANAPVGTPLRELLALDDTLLTLKLTPNLGHALSVYGVAREVSALTGAALNVPAPTPVAATHEQRLHVDVQAADLCGRFSGRVILNVNPQAVSPPWLVQRLAHCGQRSVSALVDISNYVMFESGQPTHIFDLDKIHGGLVVRWARSGEQLVLLNGQTVQLDPTIGVIADAHAVESLAGIMGGAAPAVSDETKNIYVEAAFWWPDSVAGRSRRLNFSTDAGHRFERGVDPAVTAARIERITRLIMQVCGGEPGPLDDQTLNLPHCAPVHLRVARAAKVLGAPISEAQCAHVFGALGFEHACIDGVFIVTPPSWRFDLRIEEDLIEEVARVVGYQALPTTAPRAPVTARPQTEARRSAHAVRHGLAALGYQETINYSFVEERWERELAGNTAPIRVLNPIAAPLAVMRSSMLGGLVAVLRFNLARKAIRVRVFEVGRVFQRDAGATDSDGTVAGVAQPGRVAALACGPVDITQWGLAQRRADFFDVKGDVEALLAPAVARFVPAVHPAFHPGRCARVELDGLAIGHVGEIHPRWAQAYELPEGVCAFELDLQALQHRALPQAKPIARQLPVLRDLALVVGAEVTMDHLAATLRADPHALIKSAVLFDVYRPAAGNADFAPGERSLAIRLELLDDVTPLTEERIEAAIAQAVTRISLAHDARLRA